MEPSSSPWIVYLLRCRDGSLYCGMTNDLLRRLDQHAAGEGSKYVRSRLPFKLAAVSRPLSRSQAAKAEAKIKCLKTKQKLTALLHL